MNKAMMALIGLGGFAGALLIGVVVALFGASRRLASEVHEMRTQVAAIQITLTAAAGHTGEGTGRPNVLTAFNADVNAPVLNPESFVDPMASVLGDVILGRHIYVAPFASIRGDEGQPISLGDESNVQDGVVIHALETTDHGTPVPNRTYLVNGKEYAVYIGQRVSLAHQSQVHGPARIDDGVFIGMQALVFKSWIGGGTVVEPGAKIVGVTIGPGRYVPTGAVVADQATADKLPLITPEYPFRALNDAVVHVNTSFADGYGAVARTPTGAPSEEAHAAPVQHAEATQH